MDFRSLTVKDCFANPLCVEIIKKYAPQIMKYPIKLRRPDLLWRSGRFFAKCPLPRENACDRITHPALKQY